MSTGRERKSGGQQRQNTSERTRGRERKRIKPLSKTLWVIYQTVSHTCGPQSSKNTHTQTHNYHTSNMPPLNPIKTFLAQKHYLLNNIKPLVWLSWILQACFFFFFSLKLKRCKGEDKYRALIPSHTSQCGPLAAPVAEMSLRHTQHDNGVND